MYCKHCGTQLNDTANFCRGCGAKIERKTAPESGIVCSDSRTGGITEHGKADL